MAGLRVKAAKIGVLSPSDAAVDELMRGMFVDAAEANAGNSDEVQQSPNMSERWAGLERLADA